MLLIIGRLWWKYGMIPNYAPIRWTWIFGILMVILLLILPSLFLPLSVQTFSMVGSVVVGLNASLIVQHIPNHEWLVQGSVVLWFGVWVCTIWYEWLPYVLPYVTNPL
jgi:hypothetical protein